jgi:hypothetical protein
MMVVEPIHVALKTNIKRNVLTAIRSLLYSQRDESECSSSFIFVKYRIEKVWNKRCKPQGGFKGCNNRLMVSSMKYMQGTSFVRLGVSEIKMAVPGKIRCANGTEVRNNPSRRICLLRETGTKSFIHGNQLNVWNSIHS